MVPRNIILIGYMGTGKSTVGRKIADSLGFELVDTDAAIVAGAGKPIAEIFAELGEDAFRDLESQALEEAADGQNRVIFHRRRHCVAFGQPRVDARSRLLRVAAGGAGDDFSAGFRQ